MKKNIYILFLFFSFLFSCSTQKLNNDAVTKKVKGTVSDDIGILPFVQIFVINKNTTVRKTLTDWDGNFEIEVKKGEILETSCVGFYSEQIIITDSNEYKVKLKWNDGTSDKKRQRDLKRLARKNGGFYIVPD